MGREESREAESRERKRERRGYREWEWERGEWEDRVDNVKGEI